MRIIIPLLSLLICCTPVFVSAQLEKWCGTMDGLEQRVQNDAEYAAFRQAAMNTPSSSAATIPCDGANSVVIPVAFHFDNSFSCADPTCLLTKVQEQIDALNIAYGNNSAVSNLPYHLRDKGLTRLAIRLSLSDNLTVAYKPVLAVRVLLGPAISIFLLWKQ